MKIAIYSPYLDTLGGGERYIATIAEILSHSDKLVLSSQNTVDLLLDSHLYLLNIEKIIKDIAERFDLDLTKLNLVKAPLGQDSNFLERAIFFTKYDLLFYLTDGSIFYPTATKNILHIQSPIKNENIRSFFGKLKLSGWDLIIYNSQFTKNNCQNIWQKNSLVIYPPIDTEKIKPLNKKKYILSVGRFFGYLKDKQSLFSIKKHEVLIQTFKNLYKKKEFSEWTLYLIGSAGDGDKVYVDQLKSLSKDLPIKILPNLEYKKLIELYGQSSIYWHATGFQEEDPSKMEHFGISTVEAMAAGCVPVVIKKGGQAEIVEDSKNGFLWTNLKGLEKFTLKLINDKKLMEKMSKQAVRRASLFSKKIFKEKILNIAQI